MRKKSNLKKQTRLASDNFRELGDLVFAWRTYLRKEIFLFKQKYRFALTGIAVFSICVVGVVWFLKGTVLYGYGPLVLNESQGMTPVYQFLTFILSGGTVSLLVYSLRKQFDFYKRAFDLTVSGITLLLLFPLFLIIAIMVKVDSKGPVFFKQERIGKKGRTFTILKFRSMRKNAELETGAVWAQEGDPRITRIGNFLRKTHLDELPQLINVFHGDMSLVGPRPERAEMIRIIAQKVPDFNKRLAVKPGITGLAQVRYNYGASIKDAARKLKYDLIYIQRKCWLIDFQIMLWTVRRMLTGEGAR